MTFNQTLENVIRYLKNHEKNVLLKITIRTLIDKVSSTSMGNNGHRSIDKGVRDFKISFDLHAFKTIVSKYEANIKLISFVW